MKKTIIFAASFCLLAISVLGNDALRVVERGPHHKTLERTTAITNATGQVTTNVSRYVELATGMHYLEEGEWKEADPTIELGLNGAVARKGRHKVNFSANPTAVPAIDLVAGDNKRFKSRVLGLSYLDIATGESVLIAESQEIIGILHPPNQVLYPGAFTDIKADLLYTYTKSGFAQDVVLLEQPPSPADYGLNPETTRLQVLTEFFDAPDVLQKRQSAKNGDLTDDFIEFGDVKFKPGKAFLIRDGLQGKAIGKKVLKHWSTLENREFLTEEIAYSEIEVELRKLPLPQQANRLPTHGSFRHIVSEKRLLPEVAQGRTKTSEPLQVAENIYQGTGFVIDYELVSGAVSEFTFEGNKTYHISDNFDIYDQATFEGGAVIKASAAIINVYGAFECKTGPYSPVVVTAKDDDSVGEPISGSTGTPIGYYLYAMQIWSPGVVKNFRVSHASCAFYTEAPVVFEDCQIVQCDMAFFPYGVPVTARNLLVHKVETVVYGGGSTNSFEHLTVNQCNNFVVDLQLDPPIFNSFTNSLLVSVTNMTGSYTGAVYHWFTNDPGVFQTVGAASHYLTNDSVYRNVGTTNISPSLLGRVFKIIRSE